VRGSRTVFAGELLIKKLLEEERMGVMTFADAVVERVLALLKERDMTRYRLEQLSGISHGHLQRIMTDKRKNITVKTVAMLANGFGITLAEFFDHPLFTFSNFDIEEN